MIPKYSSYPDRYGILKEFARKNRKNMTDAETVLWRRLQGRQLGYSFLRQHVIGDYIVDFVCRSGNLIVEVDGAYHSEPRQQEDDFVRQGWLSSMGYEVVRLTNEEVVFDTEKVIQSIVNKLKNTP